MLTPTGRFTTELDATAAKHHVAIAGGSGITPVPSMIATILDGEPHRRVTLLYANRTRSSTVFFDELEQLRGRHGGRLSVFHHWSREAPAGEAGLRRLGPDSVRALPALRPPVDEWIMCGPLGLVQQIAATLREHGVAGNRIRRELFSAEGTEDLTSGNDRSLVLSEVTLRMDGEESPLTLSSRGTTVLAAALPLRPDLPYSCSDGICATCRVKVVEGEVEMDRCSALDMAELRQGYVLACQAHPITERVLLDFDA
ncbi:2Fe-2S iron-sulfur cluster-binding protein [Pseudonocardia sp. H11422]|uniref:2Fe-2S iron-sulfur cluster-binding protein n=1 Tax=Pseudonocardia sp. H11422 TaxID=2835866 RepID=UPI001BDC17F8|nr:2Fe-2S iron-sulfur cluster-binding protein [Pseudonocardia sp. H11422]